MKIYLILQLIIGTNYWYLEDFSLDNRLKISRYSTELLRNTTNHTNFKLTFPENTLSLLFLDLISKNPSMNIYLLILIRLKHSNFV